MHITKLTITGIRSYKNRTVFEFSSKFNVIVGDNGAGKSSVLIALGLIFDWSQSLTVRNRRYMLSTGETCGTVEVEIENSDGRFPLKVELVKIKRVITDAHDQMFVNDKKKSANHVKDLLKLAGLSPQNPFFIVGQGQINVVKALCGNQLYDIICAICNAKDEAELSMQFAQQMPWLEREDALANERIEAMEQLLHEKKEKNKSSQQYYELEKKLHAIEFITVTRHIEKCKERLAKVEEEAIRFGHDGGHAREQHEIACRKLQKLQACSMEVAAELPLKVSERSEVVDDLMDILKQKERIELSLRDVDSRQMEKREAEIKLERFSRQIEDVNSKLDTCSVTVSDLEFECRKHAENVQSIADQRAFLYLKVSVLDNCESLDLRDACLKQKVAQFEATRKGFDANFADLEAWREKESAAMKVLDEQLTVEQQEEIDFVPIQRSADHLQTLKNEEFDLLSELRSKTRELFDIDASLSRAQEHGRKHLRSLPASVGEIHRRVEGILSDPENELETDEFLGFVVDHFECDKSLHIAVDVVAGLKLFNYVVRTDRFATKFISCWNRRKAKGNLRFIALNRLRRRERPNRVVVDAEPLMTHLKFDEQFKCLMTEVFGQTMICTDIDAAIRTAKECKVNCVTLDGDFATMALSGGYYNASKSKMTIYTNWKQAGALVAELKQMKTVAATEEAGIKARLAKVQNHLQIAEKYRLTLQTIRAKVATLTEQRNVVQQTLDQINADISITVERRTNIDANIEMLQRELGKDPKEGLTDEEKHELSIMGARMNSLKVDYARKHEKLMVAKLEKSKLADVLIPELKKKIRAVNDQIVVLDDDRDVVKQHISDKLVKSLDGRAELCQRKLDEYDRCTEEYRSLELEMKKQITLAKEEIAALDDDRELRGSSWENLIWRKERAQNELADAEERMAAAHSARSALINRYRRLSEQQLLAVRRDVERELAALPEPDLRLARDIESLTDSVESSRAEQACIARGRLSTVATVARHAENAANNLNIIRNQVAERFSRIFSHLVSHGHGSIVFGGGDDDDCEGAAAQPQDITEAKIEVCFSRVDGPTVSIAELSGGQKTITALSCIFALQQCSRAPFCFFDEIDQHLVGPLVEDVARFIGRYMGDVQIIATTFQRPLIDVADRFFGVSSVNRVSRISVISKDEAIDIINRGRQCRRLT